MENLVEVRLMPDYGCWPLWITEPESDNWDLDDVPISDELKNDLNDWVEVMDRWIDWADPGSSPPVSEDDGLAFDRRGVSLWKRLRTELGEGYLVTYYSIRTRSEYTHESELPNDLKV